MILVKGSIGSLQELTFLIDTGASSCYLSEGLARKVSRELKAEKILRTSCSYGKLVTHEVLILPEISIGSARIRIIPAGVLDISKLPFIGNHIDAIIGLSALVRANLTVDYGREVLIFDGLASFSSGTELNITRQGLIVELQIEGRNLRLLLDTGSKDLILYDKRLGDFRPSRPLLGLKTLYHLAGSETLKMFQLSGVRLGQNQWDRVSGYLMEAPIDCCEHFDGILGPPSLQLSRLHFDFQSGQVSWER